MNTLIPDHSHVRGISLLDAQKACEMGAIILDIRELYNTDYKKFGVPQVLLMPLSKADELIDNLPRDKWLIIADVSGNMSTEFCNRLRNEKFSHVCVLSGGFIAWERLGMPVFTDEHQAFSGSCVCQLKQRNL